MHNVLKIVNPILMALIIVGAVYIYFLYHEDPDGRWFFNKEEDVTEETILRNVEENVPDTDVIAGQYGQAQNQYNQQYEFQKPRDLRQVAGANENTAQQPNVLQGIEPYKQGLNSQQYQFQDDPYGLQNVAVPRNQNAVNQPAPVPGKILHEGHWIGLEVIPLNSLIAKANNIPDNVPGVLIDEVTLLAADSGLLAGDVITGINNHKIQDLESFKLATKQVANSKQGIVSIYRSGTYRDIRVYGIEELGVAQMEAAPMILATDRSPHGYYGPCDRCHTISMTAVNTGQLGKDQGDVLIKAAPPIKMGMTPRHEDRGRCTNCHRII